MEKYLINELKSASNSMFFKNFLGIFHGSISVKIEDDKFIINTKDAVFNNLKDSDFITLYERKDYRWNDASIDADIHLKIYQNISEAKYVAYTMPPFITSYSLDHDHFLPKDFFGYKYIGKLDIYDPKDFDTWYKRASDEIYKELKKSERDILIIKGYGLFSYSRDLTSMIKKIAILENSCKLIKYQKS
ncbi:MAG: hypothetical protein DSZ06_03580 [Sulfurospirillum sp.]|nr:MAG: hypothetical protein DSZ06_03580 [Sulfurospirillum sp.]